MKWQATSAALKLFEGLQLDFMERPEIAGTAQPQLSVGDDVAVEIINNGQWLNGTVTQAAAQHLVIDFGSEAWRLSPRSSTDLYNPIQTRMRLRTWYLREQI